MNDEGKLLPTTSLVHDLRLACENFRLVNGQYPWGAPPAVTATSEIAGKAVIWSCGPNGVDETNDGKSPDPAKYPKGYYWFGKGDTGDDITNL